MRKSKGKRLLSLLLTLCMVFSLVPAVAYAADDIYWSGNTLMIKDGEITADELYGELREHSAFGVELAKTVAEGTIVKTGGYKIGDGAFYVGSNSTGDITLNHNSDYEVEAYTTKTYVSRYRSVGTMSINHFYDVTASVAANAPDGAGVAPEETTAVKNTTVTLKINKVDGYDVNIYKNDVFVEKLLATDMDAVEEWNSEEITEETAFEVEYVEHKAECSVSYEIEGEGTVTFSNHVKDGKAVEGDEVAVTVTPEDNWYIESVEATAGTTLYGDNGEYTFVVGTEAIEISVVFKQNTAVTLTVANAENGVVTVAETNETETDTYLEREFEVVATPDTGYYVDKVTVNGEEITLQDKDFSKTVYTGMIEGPAVDAEDAAMEVAVTFAKREIVLKDGEYTIEMNKHSSVTVLSQQDDIEKAIKKAVIDADETAGYVAKDAEITVWGSYTIPDWVPLIGGNVIEGYNALDYGFWEIVWGNAIFNDATEIVKITLPATDRYPAVSVEGIEINVEDSREKAELTAVIAATEENPVELQGAGDEDAVKAAITAVYANDEEITNYVIEAIAMPALANGEDGNAVVTISVKETADYLAATETFEVPVRKPAIMHLLTVTFNETLGDVNVATGEVKEGSSFTLKATPEKGAYVKSVVINGAEVAGTFNDGVFTANEAVTVVEPVSVTVAFAEKTMVVADAEIECFATKDVETLQKEIFDKVVNLDESSKDALPDVLSAEAVTIKYKAGSTGLSWKELGYKPSALEGLLMNAFPTTVGSTAEVQITWTGDEQYPTVVKEATVTLTDKRETTILELNEGVEVTYGQIKADELKADLVKGVYTEDGTEVTEGEVTFVTDLKKLNAGEAVNVTLRYEGTNTYAASEATVAIKINKAPVSVTVNSATVKYGTAVADMITTDPAGVKTIDLYVGLNAANLQLDDEYKVTGAETVIMLKLPEWKANDWDLGELDGILGGALGGIFDGIVDQVIPEEGYNLSLKDTITLLQKMNQGNDAITDDMTNQVIQNLENIQAELGLSDLKINVNLKGNDKNGDVPTDIGAYLVAGITVDQNYKTAMNVGYLAITPNGQKAELDWKIHDENGAVALSALESGEYDLSAYVTKVYEGTVEGATEKLTQVFFGVDKDGNILFEQDQDKLTLGAYTELAFIADFGNEMYYAEPIARAFVVVPELVDVTIEGKDENGNITVMYDGTPHAVNVTVNGVAEPGDGLVVTYVGLQNDGTVYKSTTAPKHAGRYAVTASYVVRDSEGVVMGVGFDLATMWIKMNDTAAITVEDFVQHTFDGNGYGISNMITSTPADAKTLIITASIDTTGDVSVNGLDGIGNHVNMDFPARVDEVLQKVSLFDSAYADGMDASDVIAWIEANEAVFANIGMDADKVGALIDLLKEMPERTVVTFHEIADVAPSSVGVYMVMGMIFDPDYRPVVDTGMLVIVPATEKVTLKYVEDFNGNNIFTTEALKNIDLDAAAYDANGEEITKLKNQIHNIYIGIDAKGNEVKTTDQEALNAGIYTEYSYLLDVGNKTYYAAPISRTFIIAPDVIDVDFVDENGNVNNDRVFTYDGNAKEMNAVAKYDGVDVTKDGEMIIRYVGIEGDGEGYNSTAAPTEAGAYAVTATYVRYNENGRVDGAGFATGAMLIKKADSKFKLEDVEVPYDGDEHFVKVETVDAENAKYIAVVANRADNTVNILFPKELDAVVEKLPADVTVDQMQNVIIKVLSGIKLPARFQDNLERMIKDVNTLMDEVPDVTVTFNEDKPVNVGTYEVYAVTYAANHESVYDKAVLEITKRPVTITADDLEVIEGAEAPAFTYTVTPEDGIVAVGDLKVTLSCPDYQGETGTYDIVVNYTANDNYAVTTVNGTLTVKEGAVEPPTPEHEHDWADTYSKDATYHWFECEAEGCTVTENTGKEGYGEHKYVDGVCVCGATEGTVEPPTPEHEHTYSTEWTYDDDNHWHRATCGHENVVADKAAHKYDSDTDTTCDCGYEREITPSTPDEDCDHKDENNDGTCDNCGKPVKDEEDNTDSGSGSGGGGGGGGSAAKPEGPVGGGGGGGSEEEGMVLGAEDVLAINYLNTADHMVYMVGDDKGNFRPEASVTRAEVAQIFYNLLINKDVAITTTFGDVPENQWYAKAVNTLASMGILSGVGENKYEPTRMITRAEFATIAAKFVDPIEADSNFTDVPETHWAYNSISTAATYGWIAGVGDNMYAPSRAIKRVEAVTIVNNMLGRMGDHDKIDAGLSRQFPDVSKTHWGRYQIAEATTPHDYSFDEYRTVESWIN